MKREVVNGAWFRFRATFGHRWRGYAALVLLIALVGGLAMAGVAAARRTQSSFSTYLAATNPSAFTVSIYGASVGGTNSGSIDPSRLARLPHVQRVAAGALVSAVPVVD